MRGTNISGNHQTKNAPRQGDTYGLWMVVARRKNGSKLAKGMDPTKNLVDPNSHVLLSHHGNPAAKLDQYQVGKRKVVVDRDSMGQVTRENRFNVLVEPIKLASTDPRQFVDHGDELPSPSIPSMSSLKPQTFKQGPSSSIRRKVWRVLGLPYQILSVPLPLCRLSTHTLHPSSPPKTMTTL